ncbi:MAG: glycoside hydrolase family 2 protein [Terriglobia bacterium]
MRQLKYYFCVFLFIVTGFAPGVSPAAEGQKISLNGDWNFVADPAGAMKLTDLASVANARPTRIPSSWQQQFDDLRDYAGVAWYWRVLKLDARPDSRQSVALLRFGAVDYLADVYVNGQKVGSHEGGYLPFDFDVSQLLITGDNQIAVRVVDPGPTAKEVEGIRYAEIPHGKQNWYVQTSGLWQDVELDVRPRMHFGSVHISAGASGNFKIQASVRNLTVDLPIAETLRLKAEIRDAAGKTVWTGAADLKRGQESYELSGVVANPALWDIGRPSLYTLRATLPTGDTREERFGFRTFETRGGKFLLNGRAVYLRAALDQDFYPETIYTPPSLEFLKNEMEQAKLLGLNMLRCHIKVPDPRYLQAADEAGVLIWYEIPNWDKLTEDSKRRGMETLRGMAERDWNHPSIVVVSVINESWGIDLKDAAQRSWLDHAYHEAKAMVPWLVVDNSPCCDNFHMVTDIADFHQYNAVPDHASDFDRFVEDMARRPGWLFSRYNDSSPRGDEPLVLSEFGNWGLPRLPEEKPWWFARPFTEDQPVTLPAGVEERFKSYQLDKIFGDYNALADAAQWHQFRALKYEIDAIRARPELQGYVITEFTDLNWEANGLLDMWRKPKAHASELRKLQQDDLLVARAEKRNLVPGEKGQVDLSFSHYGAEAPSAVRLSWELEGTAVNGNLVFPAVAPGTAGSVGKIEFVAPEVDAPARRRLMARLSSGAKVISETALDFYIYPRKSPDLPPPVSFHDPAGRLRRLQIEMRARNYLQPSGSETFPVLVTSVFDDEVKNQLRSGGRVILLPSDKQTIAPGIEIVPRAGSFLDGNWISSYLWIRKAQEPFKAIGFETLPGFEIQSVSPNTVVQGLKPEAFGDVLSGIFYGWVHSNVATLIQAKAGTGKLVICTFSLGTTYGSDPYATYLLDALVRYIVAGSAPTIEIPL